MLLGLNAKDFFYGYIFLISNMTQVNSNEIRTNKQITSNRTNIQIK